MAEPHAWDLERLRRHTPGWGSASQPMYSSLGIARARHFPVAWTRGFS